MSYIVAYPGSAALYVAVGLAISVLAYLAEKKDSTIYVVLIIAVLVALSSVRGYSVGTDTSGYVAYYWYGFENDYFELLFVFLTDIMRVFHSVQAYFFVVSLLICTLFIFRIWEFRYEISFPFAIFGFYALVFFSTWNGMRFYISVAILFFATRYIKTNNYLKFAALCLIAFGFHTTAIVGLFLFGLFALSTDKLTRNQRSLLFLAVPVFFAIGVAVFVYVMGTDSAVRLLNTYTNIKTTTIGKSWYLLLILAVFALFLFFEENASSVVSVDIKVAFLLSAVGIIISLFLYGVSGIGRLSQYFIPYFPVVLAWMWSRKVKASGLVKLLAGIYVVFCLFSIMNTSGHDIMPYTLWIW